MTQMLEIMLKMLLVQKYTEAGSVSIGGHGGGVTDKDNGVKDNGDYYTVIFLVKKTMV